MFAKLTFGQKLAIWLGCALLIVIGGITAICFQMSKGAPKDMDKLIPKWARGFELKNEETWAKTEDFSSLQIEQNPKVAFWYKERGYARWWLRKYDGAIDDLSRAIELDPSDSATYGYRGQLYTYKKQYKLAVDDLTKAIELNPKSGRLYYFRGVAYDWLKDVDKAFADYDKAIELEYNLRKSHAAKANLHCRMKNFGNALTEYELAAKSPRKEEFDDTLCQLTRLYLFEEQYEKAKQSAEQWIEESHEDNAYRTLIAICKATGDSKKEKSCQNLHIDKLTERIAEDSETCALYGRRGDLYRAIGEIEKADKDYDRALELSDKDFEPSESYLKLGSRADICKKAGRLTQANKLYEEEIDLLSKEISIHPKEQELYIDRAFAYMNRRKYKAALADLERGKNSENSSTVKRAKFDILVAEKRYEEALQLLGKTEAMLSYRLHSQQARLFEKLGRHKDAIDAAKRAIDLDYSNPIAYYWLGKALIACGQEQEGEKRLQQATAFGYEPEED